MSKKKSGIWTLAMPLSVVFLAGVYYVKVPEVRKAVDARTNLVHSVLGRFVQEPGPKVIVLPGEQDPTFAKPKPPQAMVPVRPLATPAQMVAKVPPAAPPPPVPAPPVAVAPAAPPAPALSAADLQKIAADRTKWPKKVVLKKAATFPAVLNGKIVGTLVAPAGAEANVIQIQGDKLGLEFNGGGSLVPASETDFIARVQTTP